MKANKKKIIILVSLVLLLVATGCLNYFLTVKSNKGVATGGGEEISFFNSYRGERESMRAQEMLIIEESIASCLATEDATGAAAANAKYLQMAKVIETELMLEGLIKARGVSDCIVTISDTHVNVVVRNDGEIDQDLAIQIFDIVTRQTPYTYRQIILIPYV